MPGLALRPYQERAVEAIRAAYRAGRRRVLLQSPTGSGKTVVFTYILQAVRQRGTRVAILLHRRELVDQVARFLTALGIPHAVVAAGYPASPGADVFVCSVPSLVHRLDTIPGVDLLIVDEAHHSVASTWRRILDAYPEARTLGVTATPERLDGRGLADIYDSLVLGPAVAELEAQGWLAPAVVYAPARAPDLSGVRKVAGDYSPAALDALMGQGRLVGNAVEHWQHHAAGLPTIAFCCSIAHSQAVAERFRAAGVRARHVDGDTADDERRRAIAGLADGSVEVLTNCGLVSEGLDVPALGALVILRPTASLALHLQMFGRVGRPYPGKAHSVVLDHAGNVERLGLPNEPHDWSLAGRPKRPGQFGAPVKRCPACQALVAAGCRICPHCGELLVIGEPLTERPGNLVQVDQRLLVRLRSCRYREALRWAGDDPGRLHQVAQARGYKDGWVWHVRQTLRA